MGRQQAVGPGTNLRHGSPIAEVGGGRWARGQRRRQPKGATPRQTAYSAPQQTFSGRKQAGAAGVAEGRPRRWRLHPTTGLALGPVVWGVTTAAIALKAGVSPLAAPAPGSSGGLVNDMVAAAAASDATAQAAAALLGSAAAAPAGGALVCAGQAGLGSRNSTQPP
jgi:hypothetical protein